MKRFWKTVSVEDRMVFLDGRRLKTPTKNDLVLPTATLTEAVAGEWRDAGETVDPRAMPMTGLSNAAIDHVLPDPAAFAASLSAYAESELLCYRAEAPPELVARQAAIWDPLLDWARGRYDVHFSVTSGIMHVAQPAATIARLGAAVAARRPFELAALSPLVTIGGSLVAALAVLELAITADDAFTACHLDELWQAERWGEDALAAEARATRHDDYLNAARMAAMLRVA